jgi:hypothetical protein
LEERKEGRSAWSSGTCASGVAELRTFCGRGEVSQVRFVEQRRLETCSGRTVNARDDVLEVVGVVALSSQLWVAFIEGESLGEEIGMMRRRGDEDGHG